MKKLLLTLVVGLIFANSFSQNEPMVTDSIQISGHKFVLTETNGIAEIKAFSNGEEVPVSNSIKMSGPVFFVKKNGKETILQDDVAIENGDTVTVFLIVGNEAPKCVREGKNLKFKDGFCGMNVQGIIISPDGVALTQYMLNGFTCVQENPLGLKDLFTFANSVM